jgi:hypothetical protein
MAARQAAAGFDLVPVLAAIRERTVAGAAL